MDEMRKLLLLIALTRMSHCVCPDGFELVRDGQCRGEYGAVDSYWDEGITDAIKKCAEIQSNPVIIHNAEQQSYWSSRAHPMYLLIGLVCNTNSLKWEWADGSAIDYKPSTYQSILDKDCDTTRTWTIQASGYWNYGSGHTAYNFYISCTKQMEQPKPDTCAKFADDSEDGVCYQVGAIAESWQDAQMNCKKLGADLASIHNLQENSFLRRLAVSKGAVNGMYLGATISGKGGNFGWIDGSAWDYQNFYPGFPREGFGDCIAMDTTTTAGQWMNNECTEPLPVACIRDLIHLNEPNSTCGVDTWKEGQIITSPGFPFSASTPCEFFLATDKGKRIEAKIVLLEANSCCDHLIIYDGNLGGGILADLTGQILNETYITTYSNLMRVSWQPNGGVNVLGFAMTFNGV